THRVLAAPIFADARVTTTVCPFFEGRALAFQFIKGNCVTAGRLYEFYLQIEYLTGTGIIRGVADQCRPGAVGRQHHIGVPLKAETNVLILERTERQGHATGVEYMPCRFVAATGQIYPDNPLTRQYPDGVHALGRYIDETLGAGGPDKEHCLFSDEIHMAGC